MSRKTLDSNTFGDKIYKSYPKLYRDEDASVNYALKRYLQVMNDGGFKPLIDTTNDLLTLYDPDKVEADLLPHIFKSFGFDLFYGLPEDYVRKLLPLLGTMYKRKGAIEDIEFLSSLFSGIKSVVTIEEGETPYDFKVRITITIPIDWVDYKFPNQEQIRKVADEFLPFYCNAVINYKLVYDETAYLRCNDDYDDIVINEDIQEIEQATFEVARNGCILGVTLLGEGVLGVIEELADVHKDLIKYKVLEDTAEITTEDTYDDIKVVNNFEDNVGLIVDDVETDSFKNLFVLGITKLGEGKLGAYD